MGDSNVHHTTLRSGSQSHPSIQEENIVPELALASANLPLTDIEKVPSMAKEGESPASKASAAIDGLTTPTAPTRNPQDAAQQTFPPLSRTRKILIPLLCMSGTFQQASSSVGISLGIRAIGEDLDIPEYQLQWLQSSVSLAYACTLLLFGRCADIWGHKVFFISGLVMAGVFNMASGFAQTSIQMFIFRALTGAMFACVVPAAIGLLASLYPPGPGKSRAFACFAAGAPIGNAVGLVIAGLLIKFVPTGWRSFFWVSAGLTVATGIIALFVVPGPLLPNRHLKGAAVDVIGASLATAGLVLFVFALADGEGAVNGWKTPYIPACLVVGAFLVGIFILWERYLERRNKLPPLMRVSLWRKGNFAVLQIVNACLFGFIASTIFWITLYWQNYEELPVLEMTARFVTLSVMGVSVNFIGALLVHKISGQILLLIGIAGSALSALLMAINDPNATFWSYQFVSTIFTIWGADAIMLCGTLYVSAIVSHEDQAQGGSIFNTVTQLSSSLALAITTTVSDSVQRKESARLGVVIHGNRDTTTVVPKAALLKGYQAAFYTCFAFMALSGILTLFFLRDMGKVGAKKTKKQEGHNEESQATGPIKKEVA